MNSDAKCYVYIKSENLIKPEALLLLDDRDAPITTAEWKIALIAHSFHSFWKLKPKRYMLWKIEKKSYSDSYLCQSAPTLYCCLTEQI